jgi:hypothetical protein
MGQLWQIEVMRASALELENGRQDDSEKPAIATLVEDHVPEIKKPLRKIGRLENKRELFQKLFEQHRIVTGI